MVGLSACGPRLDSKHIMARVTSPDGKHDAISVRDMSGGATVGPTDELFVVRRGAAHKKSDRVAWVERACHFEARWLDDDLVEVTYFARRDTRDQSVSKSPSVGVRYRWLGRDAVSGC